MEEDARGKASESEAGGEADENLLARPYQVELLERAKERNTIVCLGTGTGKTFISVMLIKELAHEVRGKYMHKDDGRRTFFLVNTVLLASQQKKVIENHTDLTVECYVGEMGVDGWEKSRWESEFNDNNVLVMTALQVFLNLLSAGFTKLSQVNLLIFDECHHARKNHPYAQIMEFFNRSKQLKPTEVTPLPKIMGLTASVVNGKVKLLRIESEIKQLECTMWSKCDTTCDEDVENFATKPKEQVLSYSNEISEDLNELIQHLSQVLRQVMDFPGDCKVSNDAHGFAKWALEECTRTLHELGPWAAYIVAAYLINDLDTLQTSKEGKKIASPVPPSCIKFKMFTVILLELMAWEMIRIAVTSCLNISQSF